MYLSNSNNFLDILGPDMDDCLVLWTWSFSCKGHIHFSLHFVCKIGVSYIIDALYTLIWTVMVKVKHWSNSAVNSDIATYFLQCVHNVCICVHAISSEQNIHEKTCAVFYTVASIHTCLWLHCINHIPQVCCATLFVSVFPQGIWHEFLKIKKWNTTNKVASLESSILEYNNTAIHTYMYIS